MKDTFNTPLLPEGVNREVLQDVIDRMIKFDTNYILALSFFNNKFPISCQIKNGERTYSEPLKQLFQ